MRALLLAAPLLALLPACSSGPSAEPQAFLDLGIRNASAPMEGVYCAGQPTEEQFAKLRSVGVTKVIQLREPDEDGTGWEEAKAADLGLDFVRIPVAGAEGMTVDNARKLSEQLAAADGPVLVACGSSNRVGGLFALKARFLDGRTAAEALEIGRECGMTRLEPVVTELVSR